MRLSPPSFRNVCYHAQQSAEKTLKAFLVYHGQVPPKTHDCADLLVECMKHDTALVLLRPDCALVTRYGIAPRYPDIALPITKEDARDALAALRRIRAVAPALLPP